MSNIQSKWIALLENQDFPDWKIQAQEEDILITIPSNQDIQLIYKNIPEVIASLSPSIPLNTERLTFIVANDKIGLEYILNPSLKDLEGKSLG